VGFAGYLGLTVLLERLMGNDGLSARFAGSCF
jgi:hypothetical protein